MGPEARNCQNCKQSFTIEPDDFGFYEKIKVPPPTWCPECRLQRRMTWRNDWHLFRKKEVRTGEETFSIFPEESPVKIYDRDFWFSDAWDPTQFGRDYDWNKPFFAQLLELLHTVPLPAHSMRDMTNCRFCTNANNCKNCYLVRGASHTEDSAYLIWDQSSKQCMESHMTNSCELSYGNVNATKCYKTFFSVDCEDCHDLFLCKDCVGCNNCFGSFGLRNKSYYFFNTPYSKEEYIEKIKELNLTSWDSFEIARVRAYSHWLKYPHKFIHSWQNTNVSGDYVFESKNTAHSYRVRGLEDCKYCQNILTGPVKDCYDYSNYGENIELIYESLVIGSSCSRVMFSTQGYPNLKDCQYCVFNVSSSNLFGCVGLRKNQYCILNKQYTKEEYFELVPRIIEHMKSVPYIGKNGGTYRYGEFFPPEFSPFPYQISAAQEFFPLKEEEIKAKGFNWYPASRQSYAVTLPSRGLPDKI